MYELAVWIKMFHMTFSPSHNRGKVVHLVYKPQLSRKFNYNCLYTIDTHSYLINQFKHFYKVYEIAVWIKMFHMTFSPSHNRGKVVQLEYKQQQSCKFNYNYLYRFKPIATHWSLLNYLKYFKEVYELAVWIKMFHITFSPSHNRGKFVQLAYKPQQSCKFTYIYLHTIATQSYLINYLKNF